jgi:tRNA-specific 2-thiouridylase
MSKIIVALSGGVDSAVSAALLREQGHEVEALFMANWDEEDEYCSIAADFQDAQAVCRELNIILHRVNFSAQYRQQVFEYFLAEHHAGRTPNPDVLCNREIKFGVCWQYAQRLGATRLATGHYARLALGNGGIELHKGLDQQKDQSYFLHGLTQAQLNNALFPLGELSKDEVRAKARALGLPNFDKRDSTGICFIGERPFREFLERFIPQSPGPILSPSGSRLGTHQGLAFYTLGQRSGLMIGGRAGHREAPWFVARKDPARNALIVVQQHDHPLLCQHRVFTDTAHWLIEPTPDTFEAQVKLRYRQADQACRVSARPEGRLQIDCEQSQRAVTPGQFAVLYQGTRCLGGAVIDAAPLESL